MKKTSKGVLKKCFGNTKFSLSVFWYQLKLLSISWHYPWIWWCEFWSQIRIRQKGPYSTRSRCYSAQLFIDHTVHTDHHHTMQHSTHHHRLYSTQHHLHIRYGASPPHTAQCSTTTISTVHHHHIQHSVAPPHTAQCSTTTYSTVQHHHIQHSASPPHTAQCITTT